MENAITAITLALPNLIPALIGVILAAIFWKRALKASVLVCIASGLLLLLAAFQLLSIIWLTPMLSNHDISIGTYSLVTNVTYWLFYLSTLGCLMAAAFVGRGAVAAAPAAQAPVPGNAPGADGVQPHRGPMVLALSLVGLFVLPPLGIVSCIIGVSNLRAMQRGTMDNSGYGMTLTGIIIGAIDILWMLIGVALGLTVLYHLTHMNWAPH